MPNSSVTCGGQKCARKRTTSCHEFTRVTLAKFLNGRCLLLLTNLLVFLLVRCRFETLPWQTSTKEIHKNVTKRLEIITSRLFCECIKGYFSYSITKITYLFRDGCLYSCIGQSHSDSCVRDKGCAASSLDHDIAWPYQSRQRVRLVIVGLVDHVHCLNKYALTVGHFGRRSTDKKVIGLDVTVDQILVVNSLHTRDLPRPVRGAVQLAWG